MWRKTKFQIPAGPDGTKMSLFSAPGFSAKSIKVYACIFIDYIYWYKLMKKVMNKMNRIQEIKYQITEIISKKEDVYNTTDRHAAVGITCVLASWHIRLTRTSFKPFQRTLRLVSSKEQKGNSFWKPSKPCHAGIRRLIALAENSHMSTHLSAFQSFSSQFFCIIL